MIDRSNHGFTLVEVLVVVVIESIVVAALGMAFVGIMNGTNSVNQILSRSTDARLAAAYLMRDARNSSGPEISLNDTTSCTNANPPVAGTQTAVVRFNWDTVGSTGATTTSTIIYYKVATTLVRRQCQGSHLESAGVIAANVASISVACSPIANCSGTPVSITVSVVETPNASGTQFRYSLTGTFRKLNGGGAPETPSEPKPVILLGASGTCNGGTDTVNISGSASVRVYGDAYINTADGPSCSAIALSGSGKWQAGSTNIFTGGTCKSPGPWLPCPTVTPVLSRVADPYASLAAPTTSGLTSRTGCSGSQSGQTAQPGLYPSGFTLGGGSTCTLASGVYVVQGGFNVANGATLKSAAGGVLIYLLSGQFAFGGGASVKLAAAASGPYSGLVLWQAAADTQPISFSNGCALALNGAVYGPKSQLNIADGAHTVNALVVQTITLSGAASITVGAPSLSPLSISSPAALPEWTVNHAYSATINAAGGDGSYSWSATGLPAGLLINANTGVISGTPTAVGSSSVTVNVSDASGDTPASGHYTLAINAAPTISTTTLPSGTKNVAYNATVIGAAGTSPYSWSASGLPAGLSINASTGAISGTPTGTTSTVTVTLSGAAGATASKNFVLTIAGAAPSISSVDLDNGGSTAGRIEKGDTITVTFSALMSVSSFCPSWSNNSTNQNLQGNNDVSVSISNGTGSAHDALTITSAACSGFRFGSIDLGSNAFVSAAATFAGKNSSKSKIAYTASTNTLVITLGTMTSGTVATVSSSAPKYSVAPAITDSQGTAVGNSPFTLSTAKQF